MQLYVNLPDLDRLLRDRNMTREDLYYFFPTLDRETRRLVKEGGPTRSNACVCHIAEALKANPNEFALILHEPFEDNPREDFHIHDKDPLDYDISHYIRGITGPDFWKSQQ